MQGRPHHRFDASILTGPISNPAIADTYNRGLERDYSTGDIPHVLVSSVVWDFRGWTAAALVTLQSGVPLAVTQTSVSSKRAKDRRRATGRGFFGTHLVRLAIRAGSRVRGRF